MTSTTTNSRLPSNLAIILEKYEAELLSQWIDEQLTSSSRRKDLIKESELREQSQQFLRALRSAAHSSDLADISGPEWLPVRDMLAGLSRSRAIQGFSPSETATFIFSFRGRCSIGYSTRMVLTRRAPFLACVRPAMYWMLGSHTGMFPKKPRRSHLAPAGRDAGIVHPGSAIVRCHPRVASDWHARQRAHTSGDGESAAADCGNRRRNCHHRYYGRTHCRYAGGAASPQGRVGRPLDGRRLHHQRHSSANRSDDCSSGGRTCRRATKATMASALLSPSIVWDA